MTSLYYLFVFIVAFYSTSSSKNDINGDKDETAVDDAENFIQESGVYVLTDENFGDFVQRYPSSLIEFYAPWCGHCKRLEPEYASAAKTLAAKRIDAALGKLDATVNKKMASKYEVQGYPTLKFFKNGEVMEYDGERNSAGIVQWLEEKTDPNYKAPPSSVVVLTMSNFSQHTLEQDITLVEFYAPWCGHCKKLAPEYEKAAKRLSDSPLPIFLAKVDATVEKDLATKYGVKGFPTMKIFRKGRVFDFDGPRDAEGIVKYMIDESQPAARELKSIKEAEKALSKDDITIIGFFDQADRADRMLEFQDACDASRRNFRNMYYTFNADISKHMKVKQGRIGIFYPQKYWSKFEPKAVFFEQENFTREEIIKFLIAKCIPLVGQRTNENVAVRYNRKPLVVVYYTVDFSLAQKDETQFWRNKILNVASKYPSYIFAISDDEEFKEELRQFHLDESPSDVNVIVFGEKKRYRMDPEEYDEFNEETFAQFMKDLEAGRVKPFIKSQPVPKIDNESVKTLVASNFEEVVFDESKDVLVEFYAPWCGHCKALAPIYEELATKLKSDPNIVIAKFDATANDLFEEYPVDGFPTIFFAPSGNKRDPILYQDARNADALMKFLRKHAVKSFQKSEL